MHQGVTSLTVKSTWIEICTILEVGSFADNSKITNSGLQHQSAIAGLQHMFMQDLMLRLTALENNCTRRYQHGRHITRKQHTFSVLLARLVCRQLMP